MRPSSNFTLLGHAAYALALLAWLAPREAHAHAIGLSRGDYSFDGTTMSATVVIANRELTSLLPAFDANHDGALDAEELTKANDALTTAIASPLTVEVSGSPCPTVLSHVALIEEDGVQLQLTARCAKSSERVSARLGFVASLSQGHRHIALFDGGSQGQSIVFASQPTIEISAHHTQSEHHDTSFGALFKMGVEHILTGYDHLLFLFGLIIVGGRPRALVGVITAFTVGHSFSLALATLGVFSPSPSIIEPAIALSIALVGIENFFIRDAARRWRITLPFGLIHGFGFAGALTEISLAKDRIPPALLAFNLGVETGQLAVLALVLPLVLLAHRSEKIRDKGIKVISALIIVVGLVWFVQRIG
ncbi:MAG: HupE/UreJ family protein [Polyangiaceae bacterium]